MLGLVLTHHLSQFFKVGTVITSFYQSDNEGLKQANDLLRML